MADLVNPTNFALGLIALCLALFISAKLARQPEYGLGLIAFFLPFERIPSFDIAGFTFKINHFIGGLTLLFLLLAMLFNRRRVAPNPLAIPLGAMLLTFLLAGLNAGNEFRHLTVFVSIVIMLGLYLAVINCLTDRRVLNLTIGGLLLGALLMGLIGLYQFFGDLAGLPAAITGLDPGYTKVVFGFPRIHAFSKEPLYFANYLFIPLGIALGLFFSGQHRLADSQSAAVAKRLTIETIGQRLRGPWLLPLIILLAINFLLTLSRGAFISSVPFALIFAVLYAKDIFRPRNIFLAIAVAVISLGAVYQLLDSVSYDALDRFLGHAQLEDVLVKKQGESGFGRLQAFGQAMEAWGTSPLTGIGLGNFGPYIKYYPVEKPGSGWDIVNNEYLELLAETGLLGLASVLLVLFVLFMRSLKAYRALTGGEDDELRAVLVGLTAALAGIFTQYNFFSTLYIIHVWVAIGLLVGVQNIVLYQPKSKPSANK